MGTFNRNLVSGGLKCKAFISSTCFALSYNQLELNRDDLLWGWRGMGVGEGACFGEREKVMGASD